MYIGPQTRNARKPPFPLVPANVSPLPGGGLVFGNCPQAKTVDFVPTKGLPESILKRRFPSMDKPLKKGR